MRSFDNAVTQIRTYLSGESESIQEAFCTQKGDHLIIGVDQWRYFLGPLQDSSPGETIEGLFSLDELLSLQTQKPEPVIQDLLYEGETVVVAGRPKVGKSRLVQQMTLSLSQGLPFLGMGVPRKRRVLVVDLENKPWAIRDRLRRMAAQNLNNAFVFCSDTLQTKLDSSPDGISKLERLLDQTKADVLIIDPWRLWLNGDENDAEDVVKGLKVLSTIRKTRPTLTIIIVHHIRKERFESPTKLMDDPSLWVENVSGHSALVGHVDACYGLERQDHEGEEIVIFGGIARNVETRIVMLNDDPESLRFDVAATEEAAKIIMTPKERDLWEKAKSLKQFTWSAFLALAGTKNKKLISSMLKKAQGHGLIKKAERDYTVIGAG